MPLSPALAVLRRLAFGVAASLALAAPSATRAAGPEAATPALQARIRDAQGRERAGPRDPRFDADFERAARGLRPTADPLGIDDLILLRAGRAIAARGVGQAAAPGRVASRGGRVAAGAFGLVHDRLLATFARRVALDAATAGGLAAEIEAQMLNAAGISRRAYLRVLGVSRPGVAARRAAARAALAALFASSRIDRAFEVPYVAGYDREAGDYVFVDCAMPFAIRRAGRVLPVGPLLVLHERVEKAVLLDDDTIYPSAHQIALRLEKAAARAVGAPWRAYDDFITEKSDEIDKRDHAHVSDRLDLLPYETFADAGNLALLKLIERGTIAHARRADPKPGPAQRAGAVCPGSGLE